MSRDEEVCEIDGVARMRANRIAVAALLVVGLASLFAMIGVPLFAGLHGKDAGAFMRVMFYGVVGGLFGAWHLARWHRRPEAATRKLRATREGVDLDGARIVDRREVKRAYVMPSTRHGTIVRIERKGLFSAAIELRVKDVARGRDVLRALGVDAAHLATSMSIRATSRTSYRRRVWLTIAAIPLSLFLTGFVVGVAKVTAPIAGPILGGVMLLLWPLLVLQLFLPAKIIVGADGVIVAWLGREIFHPLRELVRAEVVDGQTSRSGRLIYVRMHRKVGAPVDVVAAAGRSAWNSLARQQAAAIAERINEAIESRADVMPPIEIAALARASRPIDEWIAALRAMVEKTQTFREGAALALDQLWRVLEDPAVDAERRAAAAAALSPKLDDDGRARLRVVADATVAPKLRVALEAAAEGDDPKLADALQALDATR